MASPLNALVCALIATAFWSLLGYALGSRLVPRVVCDRCCPGDRLVGARRCDVANLFVV